MQTVSQEVNSPASSGVITGPIAIVGGTGPEGFGLALRLAHAQLHVRIGSRNAERARNASEQVRQRTGSTRVEGFENSEAVRDATIVIVTVPSEAQVDTLEGLRASLRTGTTLVDTTVRLKSTENSAQIAAQHLPEGVWVASAFHTVGAELLEHLDETLDSDVLICSDEKQVYDTVAHLVRLLPGARPVDAGALKNSRLVENMVQLLIAINRRNKVKHAGIRITGV